VYQVSGTPGSHLRILFATKRHMPESLINSTDVFAFFVIDFFERRHWDLNSGHCACLSRALSWAHALSPFCFTYFLGKALLFALGQPGQ
jgi:hypothetical protein